MLRVATVNGSTGRRTGDGGCRVGSVKTFCMHYHLFSDAPSPNFSTQRGPLVIKDPGLPSGNGPSPPFRGPFSGIDRAHLVIVQMPPLLLTPASEPVVFRRRFGLQGEDRGGTGGTGGRGGGRAIVIGQSVSVPSRPRRERADVAVSMMEETRRDNRRLWQLKCIHD